MLSSVAIPRQNRSKRQIQAAIEDTRNACELLSKLSDRELRDRADATRESIAGKPTAEHFSQSIALAAEALRRAVGVELYDSQLQAARAVATGQVAEMQTGEGKTFSVAPAAVSAVLHGQAVHVVTPNSYLAERDFRLLSPAFEVLGLTTGLLPEFDGSAEEKKAAYDCDITYGTGFDFGFDFLRDQTSQQPGEEARKRLGDRLLEKLSRNDPGVQQMQRGHEMAIVDEVDNVLLDDAISPLILCDIPPGEASDADACTLAQALVSQLQPFKHFEIEARGSVGLTADGEQFIHADDVPIPFKQLRRPWSEYVQQALTAEHVLDRGVHYLLDDAEIRIVDTSTGRIFTDRSWSEGLHQAIEAKEHLPISNERAVLAQITKQRYFRLYQRLAGMTGTAVGCEREFQSVYGLRIATIPRRRPCLRQIEPMRVFSGSEAKWQAIAEDVAQIHRYGRPILIGTRTIADSHRMATFLESLGIDFQLLNGTQDAEEAEIVGAAGEAFAVTISTNLAGRGTDIQLDEHSRDLGGLHVIVSEPNELERVDRQLIGRSARQGDPGSARTYLSPEDALIRLHGPWLAAPIQRCAQQGELHIDITRKLARVQSMVERRQASARMQLIRRDLARESLLSRMDLNS